MRVLWCWRCRMEVPMLDEEEFEALWRFFHEARIAAERDARAVPLSGDVTDRRGAGLWTALQRALDEYNRITGDQETNPNAIWHHRLSIYGPPCSKCGKPLRTPRA